MLQLCTIYACANGTLGLNLSRAPWDPYPWVSGVQEKSSAERGGVRIGDTLLELNGVDILGLRISELANRLAEHWHSGAECVTMMMWRQQAAISSPEDADEEEASHAVHGINQQSLQKFATCLQHISQLLECPVCLEVIKPPGWQCCNGHVLCNNCRSRSVKCPVCRVPLGPRGRCLLSDKLFTLLAESFPCDGGKSNKVTADQDQCPEGQRKLSSVNKCTNEYHNQPKMALAKSNSGKKCGGKQISRQLQLQDAVAVVVLNARDRDSSGAGATGDVGNGGNGGVLLQQQQQQQQMPKGNEENARIRNNVADNSNHSSRRWHSQGQDEKDLQRCTLIKVQHQESRFNQEQQQKKHQSMLELLESNNMLVKPKLKLSKKSCRITGKDQDGLRSDEVANINTGQHQTTVQEAKEELQLGQELGQEQVMQSAGGKGQLQFQNYHCPTGKSCISSCNSSNAMLKLSQPAAGSRNKLSTVKDGTATAADAAALGARVAAPVAAEIAAATLSVGSHKQAPATEVNQAMSSLVSGSGASSIKSCEWQLLRHLSSEHRLAVLHSYGTFGERLHVQLPSQQAVACLSLSEDVSPGHENVRVHTFFLAVIPLSTGHGHGHGHAVFLWHLDLDDRQQEEPQFETVIETQGGRVKWFGPAHSLSRSWPEIAAAGHFLTCHNQQENACAAFDIAVKRKYP